MGDISEVHEEYFGMRCDMCDELMPNCDCEEYPDATGGHAAVEQAAAKEVEAGPNGTTET